MSKQNFVNCTQDFGQVESSATGVRPRKSDKEGRKKPQLSDRTNLGNRGTTPPRFNALSGKAVKKGSASVDALPSRPTRALRSLLSVALSSRWAEKVYHFLAKYTCT